tara:strand:+ start:220 stop:345 length:126 start_codon:yes stop_codon:yes gene_type:complete
LQRNKYAASAALIRTPAGVCDESLIPPRAARVNRLLWFDLN